MEFFRPSRSERPMPPRIAFLAMVRHGTGVRRDALDQFIHGLFELGFGDEAVYQTHFQSAVRGHGFSG